MLMTLIVETDHLSVTLSNSAKDGILQKGYGNKNMALWHTSLTDPESASAPYRLRVPDMRT